MLAGVSTRKLPGVGEPVGESVEQASSSASKTAVSDMCIARTVTALGELMSRRLDDVRLAVMMLDGLDIADRGHVVALAISTEGVKIPLGLREGSTENATLARALLSDLVVNPPGSPSKFHDDQDILSASNRTECCPPGDWSWPRPSRPGRATLGRRMARLAPARASDDT